MCTKAIMPPTHISHVQAMADLDWQPEFSLLDGLRDSYDKDFGRGTFRKEANFTCDDMILAKKGLKVPAAAGARSGWR